MWQIEGGGEEVQSERDSARWLYILVRDDGADRPIYVELSRTLLACEPDALPSDIADAVSTNGRSMVERVLGEDEPADSIRVNSTGWTEHRTPKAMR